MNVQETKKKENLSLPLVLGVIDVGGWYGRMVKRSSSMKKGRCALMVVVVVKRKGQRYSLLIELLELARKRSF